MPAYLDDWPCAACGGRHTLSLDDQTLTRSHRDFSYLCPATAQAVSLQIAFWDRVNADGQGGAVALLLPTCG